LNNKILKPEKNRFLLNLILEKMKLFTYLIVLLILQMEFRNSFGLFQYAWPIYGLILRNNFEKNKKEIFESLKKKITRQNTHLIGK